MDVNVTGLSQPVRYSEGTVVAQHFLEGLSLPTLDDGLVSPPLSGSNGCSDHVYVCWILKEACKNIIL